MWYICYKHIYDIHDKQIYDIYENTYALCMFLYSYMQLENAHTYTEITNTGLFLGEGYYLHYLIWRIFTLL